MFNKKSKRSIAVITSIFLILVLFTGLGSAYSGSGTSSDPYILTSVSDFSLFDSYPSAYYALGGDIDCSDSAYGGYASSSGFSGTLNGNDYSILNDNYGGNGLFAYLNGATIHNLTFNGCTFTGTNGGALAGYITGSSLTTITNVNVAYSSITCSGADSNFYKGGIVGAVNGGNVKMLDCYVMDSVISASTTFIYSTPRPAYTGGIIGIVAGTGNSIEIGNCAVINTKISSPATSAGIIGTLKSSTISALNIHGNIVNSCDIECGWESHSTSDGILAHASGILSYDGATSSNPLDIYITGNTVYNTLISGNRGGAGISYEASSGYLRPHYSDNIIAKSTIYQSANQWYQGESTYYAGGFHGSGSIGSERPSYEGNELAYLTIYSSKVGAQQYSTYYVGITNLFAPSGLSYQTFTNNIAVYCDLGSAGSVGSRILPSSVSGNEYHDIDAFSSYLNLTGITVNTDSENMRAKTFSAVQRGAVLSNEANTKLDGYGVKPQYRWDYTGDGTIDYTSTTYYSSYTYPSDGEYHPSLTASLLGLSVDRQTSTNASTQYMGAPLFVSGNNILKNKDIQTYGGTVRLTANMITGYAGATYEFLYSTDNGNTWLSYASPSPYSYKDITFISASEQTSFVKYKVIATNSYGSTTSDVLNFLWTPSATTTETITKLSLTSDTDTYALNFSVAFPFDTVKTQSFSSYYTIVTTKNAIYLLQNNVVNESQVIRAKLENYDSYIVDSDVYGGNIVYRTDDNRAYYTYITEDMGFNNSIELNFAGDNLSQISIGANALLLRSMTSNTEYVQAYNFGSETPLLSISVIPYTYTNWRILSYTNDNSNTPAVICSYTNGDKKVIRCYTSQSNYYDTEQFTANTITNIKPFLLAGKIVLSTNNGKSFIVPYRLTQSEFNWGNVISGDDIPLTDITPTYYDIRYIGISAPSTVVFMASSSGQAEATYPVSSTLTSVDISAISGLYAISGDYNGRLNVMWNNNGQWEGLQSVSVGHPIVDTSISGDYLSLSGITQNAVYLGVYQKYTAPSTDTVLDTNKYVKIVVYDSSNNLIQNTAVTLIGSDLASTLTTGNDGSVTFLVKPSNTYTIQTNGITQTFVADNSALKTISIYLSSINYYENLTFSSNENNNIISTSFAGNGKENYNMVFKVFNENNTVIFNTTYTGASHTFTLDKTQYNASTYTITISITGQTSGITESRTYVYHNYNKSEKGYLILGDIPILPDMLDNNWVKLLFGGLLMVIGGLFSAQHSAKGCVLVVIIASFLTWVGILPLNPIWIGCLIVLSILTLYSFASKQET